MTFDCSFGLIGPCSKIKETRLEQLVERLYWKDVRNDVHKIAPKLTEIIDSVSPQSEPLYLISFPYGQRISDEVSPFIPNNNNIFVRLAEGEIDKKIFKELEYGKDSSPLGLVLEKSIEFFVDIPEKQTTIPTKVIGPGDFCNFSSILSASYKDLPLAPNGLLRATAGARTTFSLPYLTCSSSFANLEEKYPSITQTPSSQYDHFQLFKEIVSDTAHQGSKPWRMKVLYFSEQWIKKIIKNKDWAPLNRYFFQLAWKESEHKRNKHYFDIHYSKVIEEINCKYNSAIKATIKHVTDIAIGGYPGLAPQMNNELVPLEEIQYALSHHYGLKKYSPAIIAPSNFNYKSSQPIYYSLQHPTACSYHSLTYSNASMMDSLKEIQRAFSRYKSQMTSKSSIWNGTRQYDALSKTNFHFIHCHKTRATGIEAPDEFIKRDKRFNYVCEPKSTKLSPAANGNFFRGCICITPT